MSDWEKYGTCPKCHRTMHDEVLCACGYDRRNVVLDSIGEDLKKLLEPKTIRITDLATQLGVMPETIRAQLEGRSMTICVVCQQPVVLPTEGRPFHETCIVPSTFSPRQWLEMALDVDYDTSWEKFKSAAEDPEADHQELFKEALEEIHKLVDYMTDHLCLNPRKCAKCGDRATTDWREFRVCAPCQRALTKQQTVVPVTEALDIMNEVFRKAEPVFPHWKTCEQRRTKHRYAVETSQGYVAEDSDTCFASCINKATLFTKAEVEQVKKRFEVINIYRRQEV